MRGPGRWRRRAVELIESYLAISGPVSTVAERVTALVKPHGIDLSAALDAFERRLALISVGGFAIEDADFSAEFGRSFSYYTGFVFEVLSPKLGPKSPLAGGGRYDGMLKIAGAPKDVPAVGAAIYTERVLIAVDGGRAMSDTLVLAVPSKGRLMDQTANLFAGAGMTLAQGRQRARLSWRDRRAGRRGSDLCVGLRDRVAAGGGARAHRHHRRGPDPRADCRMRKSA